MISFIRWPGCSAVWRGTLSPTSLTLKGETVVILRYLVPTGASGNSSIFSTKLPLPRCLRTKVPSPWTYQGPFKLSLLIANWERSLFSPEVKLVSMEKNKESWGTATSIFFWPAIKSACPVANGCLIKLKVPNSTGFVMGALRSPLIIWTKLNTLPGTGTLCVV